MNNNYGNNNTYNNENNYGRNHSYMNTANLQQSRWLLKIAAGCGMVFGIGLHLFALYTWVSVFLLNNPPAYAAGIESLKNMNNFYSTGFSFLIVFLTYSFVKTVIFSTSLFHHLKYSSDEEIMQNKWTLILLGLSVGGFFIPMLLRSALGNFDTVGTNNSKILIGKKFGLSWMFSAIVSAALLLTITFSNGGTKAIVDSNAKTLFLLTFGLLLVSFVFSMIVFFIFNNKNIDNELKEKTQLGKTANFLSYIMLTIVTFQLIVRILLTVLNIIAEIIRMFQRFESRNALDIFIGIMMIFFEIMYIYAMIYLISIIWETIRGLWRAQKNNGVVVFNKINNSSARKYEEYLTSRRSRRRGRMF